MLKGIHLTLMIGPVIPIVAPKVVIEALTNVQVTNSKDRSGFQLTFTVGKDSPIIRTLLPTGYFDPITTRVMIIVTLNGMPNVLMDGFVTNQQFAPANEAGKTNLTITGEDVSIAMDLVKKFIPFPAFPAVAQINMLLAPYALLGVIPLVIPPIISLVRSPTESWNTQSHTTDREYLKSMAQQCGYIFYVQAGPIPGQSIAYFGPDVNLPIPQKAITINYDAHSNAESLSFTLDGTAKKVRIHTIMDPFTKKIPIPIPVPNISVFKPPLGVRPTMPSKIEFADDMANADIPEASQSILAFLMNNSAAISATGAFDVMRYKNILRARMLVGIRGSGLSYDGLYYVDSVTHNIKKGEYKQNFTLSRDGLISNTPFLPV